MDESLYSEKTHLIHGRSRHCEWDYRHHVVPPMSASVTYRLDSGRRGAQGFQEYDLDHLADGEHIYIYDRLDEPTRAMLEDNLAFAEGGECAVAFASGMGAIAAALCCCAKTGEHILTHQVLYGCTFSLLNKWLPRFGIETSVLDLTQKQPLRPAIQPNTRVVYFETPINPDLRLIDIAYVVEQVRQINESRDPGNRILVIVDNTFSTPHGQRPLHWGVDLVVSSLTKNIGGFGTDMGGVVVGPRVLESRLLGFRKDFGAVLSPKNAWPILIYGLPTLSVRMRQQQETAMRVASFLQGHPRIASVSYPGLESYPQAELARRQMVDYEGQFAPGTMIYFTLKETEGTPPGESGGRFIDSVAENSYAITMAVSLGQVRTLIEHPYSMTHSSLAADPTARSSVDPAGLRLSIGLEKGDDLIRDLQQALEVSLPVPIPA